MRKWSLLAVLLFACGGEKAESSGPATPAGGGAAASGGATTFAAQVSAGQKLYGEKCASCHGSSGEGGKGPRVVGMDKGALPLDPPADRKYRKNQFKTAADVAEFVVKAMPPGGDSSLKEEDYWAILAFDLHANGVDLPNKIDGSNAKEVVLHK
jgi:S-disulfanyl-L-cysteine oxidoreductase SoxD